MNKIKFLVALAVLLLVSPAYAAEDEKPPGKAGEKFIEKMPEEQKEEKTEPVVYSPEGCQFNVTFPGEPYTIQRCEGEDGKKCYDLTSYTHTFDMAATVNFRVICNKIDKDIYNHYSAEVMEATLKAMTKQTIIKEYSTSYRDEKNYKQAGLVGEGKVGRSSTIYIAQLWIANGSALSMEAEMIGEQNNEADLLFSEVLKSVGYKKDAKSEEKSEKTSEDKKEEPKEEKKSEESKSDEKPAEKKKAE